VNENVKPVVGYRSTIRRFKNMRVR